MGSWWRRPSEGLAPYVNIIEYSLPSGDTLYLHHDVLFNPCIYIPRNALLSILF
jgi:hypothetical protein